MGVMLSRLLGFVLGMSNGAQLVMTAFGGTAIVFGTMATLASSPVLTLPARIARNCSATCSTAFRIRGLQSPMASRSYLDRSNARSLALLSTIPNDRRTNPGRFLSKNDTIP